MPVSFLAHLPLHRRGRASEGGDPDVELAFWTETWDAHIRGGALFAPGGLELLGEDAVAADYEGRRWQEARAQVRRILREAELLGGDAVYLACGAERIPLLDESVDAIVARNSLDHVADPAAVMAEVKRLLRPGGTLILNVDVEGVPTEAEPHAFSVDDIRRLVAPRAIERERLSDEPHGHEGRQMVVVARRRD